MLRVDTGTNGGHKAGKEVELLREQSQDMSFTKREEGVDTGAGQEKCRRTGKDRTGQEYHKKRRRG